MNNQTSDVMCTVCKVWSSDAKPHMWAGSEFYLCPSFGKPSLWRDVKPFNGTISETVSKQEVK